MFRRNGVRKERVEPNGPKRVWHRHKQQQQQQHPRHQGTRHQPRHHRQRQVTEARPQARLKRSRAKLPFTKPAPGRQRPHQAHHSRATGKKTHLQCTSPHPHGINCHKRNSAARQHSETKTIPIQMPVVRLCLRRKHKWIIRKPTAPHALHVPHNSADHAATKPTLMRAPSIHSTLCIKRVQYTWRVRT